MELPDALAHALGLRRPDAEPEDLHLLRERFRICQDAVVVRLRVELRPTASPPAAPLNPPIWEKRSRRLKVIWNVWIPPIEKPAIARWSRSAMVRNV